MKFEHEIKRLFRLWIIELESNGDWLQVSIVNAVLSAFLSWYGES